jgi:enamine deaminase RidA (YjgF/YER057c/UK114 family)
MSAQAGIDKNGDIPSDVIKQLELALDNIFLNLEAAGMTKKNLVKIVFYFASPVETELRRSVIKSKLGDHHPCISVIYVSGLATDALKIEIDAWACIE